MYHNTTLKHTYGKDLIEYNSKTPSMFISKIKAVIAVCSSKCPNE